MNFLPRQDVAIVDANGRTTNPFYVWMQGLGQGGVTKAQFDALVARVDALQPGESLDIDGPLSILAIRNGDVVTLQLRGDYGAPGGGWYYGTNEDGLKGFWPIADAIVGTGSVVAAIDYGPYNFQGELDSPNQLPVPAVVDDAYLIGGSLWVGEDDDGLGWNNTGPAKTKSALALVNDEDTPSPTHYYGTNAAGDKGFHAVADTVEAAPDELTKSVDGDGVTTFGLADVNPTAGGTLQLTQFDAKGRRTHEDEATTDDLPEGATNLYFTDDRAQDAVGAVADDTGDVELHYETSPARRLWAKLSDAILAIINSAVQPSDLAAVATTGLYSDLINKPSVISGGWSPTLTNVANITASSLVACRYARIGNVVHVSGTLTITPTATSAAAVLHLSLPIASAIAANQDGAGSGAATYVGGVAYETAFIRADAATDRLAVILAPLTTNAYTIRFTAAYDVIGSEEDDYVPEMLSPPVLEEV